LPKRSHSEYKPRIFLCHASEDKPQVQKLYRMLKEAGYHPWLDIEDLLPGQDWETEIKKVIRDPYNIVVVCLSKNSVTKRGVVQKEIKWALDVLDQMPEDTIYLIPARLEACHVPERLSKIHWVDLFEKHGLEKLKQALNSEIHKRLGSTVVEDSAPESAKETSAQLYQAQKYLSQYSHLPEVQDNEWELLLGRIRDGTCVPVLGPGIHPKTFSLARELLKQYQLESVNVSDSLTDVAQLLVDEYEPSAVKKTVQDLLTQAVPPDFTETNEPHRILADLPLSIYITTNYDNFMVQALENRNRPPKYEFFRWNRFIYEETSVFQLQDDFDPSPEEPIVFFLYGRGDVPESLVLSADDDTDFVVKFTNDQALLPPVIRTALASSSLLFIGHSFRDKKFQSLMRSLRVFLERGFGGFHFFQFSSLEAIRKSKQLHGIIYWGETETFVTELRDRWSQFTHAN